MSENEEKPEATEARSSEQSTSEEKKTPRKKAIKEAKMVNEIKEKASESTSKEGGSEVKAEQTSNGSKDGARNEPVKGVRDVRTAKNSTKVQEVDSDSKQPQNSTANEENNQGKRARTRSRSRRGKGPENQQQQLQPLIVNEKEVAKRAWKIFLGEVNEDGVVLIDDKAAREITKRSFRIAELFTEEQARREQAADVQVKRRKEDTKEQKKRVAMSDKKNSKDEQLNDSREDKDLKEEKVLRKPRKKLSNKVTHPTPVDSDQNKVPAEIPVEEVAISPSSEAPSGDKE